MTRPIDDPERADRLARAICSDLRLYHWDELKRCLDPKALPAQVAEALKEGRALYDRRVSDEIRAMGIFERVVEEFPLVGPERVAGPPPVPKRSSTVDRSNTPLIIAIVLCFGIAALLWLLR